MAKFNVEVGDEKAKAKIAALFSATKDREPLHATIGSVLVNRIRLGFKLGVDPWGSPWAALKIRKGQPLRDTGLLQASITSRPDNEGVTVGTNKIQARTHQFGATITPKTKKRLVFPGPGGKLIFAKKVTIPARPFMPLKKGTVLVDLPPDWSKSITTAMRTYFRQAAEKEIA